MSKIGSGTVQIVDEQGNPVDLTQLKSEDVIRVASTHFGVLRRNCEACRHNHGEFGCGIICGRIRGSVLEGPPYHLYQETCAVWLRAQTPTIQTRNCPQDADGCPGWEAKPIYEGKRPLTGAENKDVDLWHCKANF